MKTNDNTNRLKTYKIKNHDSGKTYSVKAVSYTDAKMKYNNYILKDSITEDEFTTVMYGERKENGNKWSVETNDLQKTKRELSSAGYKYIEHYVNKVRSSPYRYTVLYTKDSITEDAISKLVQNYLGSKKPKTKAEQDEIINFLLERNDIAKEDVQKVRSLLKIVKDSITEDANESQYFEQAKRLRGKELTQGKYAGYRIRRVTKSVTGKLWYSISDGLNDRTISHDEMLKGMNARNIDLFDSITEDADKVMGTYKIKNNDSGKTYRVKATSYTDAKDKYNAYILKDSIAEDAEKKYGIRATQGNNKGYFLGNYDRSWVSENSKAITKLSKEEAEKLAKQQLKKYGATVVQLTDSLIEDAETYSYQFPSLTAKDLEKANDYKLLEVKKVGKDIVLKGSLENLKRFAEKYLGYELVKEYLTKDSITEDADLTGKIVKYDGMTVKVLRKLTEQEKQKRAHLNNPDAGDYYEVETTSKAIGTSKFIVWGARLRDSITEDADIAQNDIKSSYLPEDANADNIQYLGFNEKRKLSFYSYGDRYFVHHDLEGRTEEIDKATVQKILKKNILGEIDENDLINKEPQSEEIVSDSFEDASTSVYAFKQGQRADAFKQYLRDRGLKFEPSQDGRLVVFVVFNADEAVDQKAIEITRTLRDSFEEDASIKDSKERGDR